jgi:ribosome-binding ATPase YchF (GTP1/OBG family)
MKIGLIGRTNVGKSTLFKALTLEDIAIEDRPFTTIEPNKGIGYVKMVCPEKDMNTKCQPRNAPCVRGYRYVPVDLIDVAGLISGAHEGKGLGNKFLSDAMEADALIEVVDISGRTDGSGAQAVDYDPANDIRMVKSEVTQWIASLLTKRRKRSEESLVEFVHRPLSGLGISYEIVKEALNALNIETLDDDNVIPLSERIFNGSKPIIIACNKMDVTSNLDEKINRLKEEFDYTFVPCSAGAELTLKEAEKTGFIEYDEDGFKVRKQLNHDQETALSTLKKVLDRYGGTGVQKVLNTIVFEVTKSKVVFPVEDEKRLSDARGNVLPDAYIVKESATPLDVARKIHSEVADKYKGAIDCRTGLKVKNDEPVKNGQIIKILV